MSLSAFDIRQLLGNEAIANGVNIHAPDVARLSIGVHPIVPPAHHTPLAQREYFFNFNAGLAGVIEELLPKGADGGLAFVTPAIGRRERIFKHAVGRHELHHRLNIAGVEGLVEADDDREGVRGCQR